jgi:hypothetical protein
MYCSGNLPALEKCHCINGMSPHLDQASASEVCGKSSRNEGGLKTMLSNCHCCVSFHVEWFSVINHHHHLCFASLSSYMIQVDSCKSTRGETSPDDSCKLHHVNAAAQVEKSVRRKFERFDFEVRCDLHETCAPIFL